MAPLSRRFSTPVIRAIDEGKVLGVRAGLAPHRFLGIWAVVVKGRVFVRPWNDKPTGWYRVFLDEPRGALQVPGGRERAVRARRVTSPRLLDAISDAYAVKFGTPGSRKWVRGLATVRRRARTLELLPR